MQTGYATDNYVLDPEVNPNVKLLPMSNHLFWTQKFDGDFTEYNSTPFELDFVDENQGVTTTLTLINPTDEFTMLTPYILGTAGTNSKGERISFQRVEGSGVVPWDKIKLTRYIYNPDNKEGTMQLVYIVTAALERIQ